jgi:hypothetical protein
MNDDNEQPGMRPNSARQRQVGRAIWFASAALYLLVATATLVLTLGFGVLPEQERLQKQHAEHVAELTFTALYSLMLHGADRAELQQMALRMETAGQGQIIRFARGDQVARQFGELRDSTALQQHDALVQTAFASATTQSEVVDGHLRVAYPARFRTECRSCHDFANHGDVAGVILVRHPPATAYRDTLALLIPLGLIVLIGLPVALLAARLLFQRSSIGLRPK